MVNALKKVSKNFFSKKQHTERRYEVGKRTGKICVVPTASADKSDGVTDLIGSLTYPKHKELTWYPL